MLEEETVVRVSRWVTENRSWATLSFKRFVDVGVVDGRGHVEEGVVLREVYCGEVDNKAAEWY